MLEFEAVFDLSVLRAAPCGEPLLSLGDPS
jgi:hypothetical protein